MLFPWSGVPFLRLHTAFYKGLIAVVLFDCSTLGLLVVLNMFLRWA